MVCLFFIGICLSPFGTYSVSFWFFSHATYGIAFFFFLFFFFVKILCAKRSEVQARTKADTNFKASIMHCPKVLSFNPKNQTHEFDLFILCKGLNSGKPLEKPCPNCFVISCKNSDEFDFFKTLSFGLWKAKHFQQFLVGSVIPFLRIDDFRATIKAQADEVSKDKYAFVKDVHKVKLIERKEKQMKEYLLLLADVKRAMIYRHLKR